MIDILNRTVLSDLSSCLTFLSSVLSLQQDKRGENAFPTTLLHYTISSNDMAVKHFHLWLKSQDTGIFNFKTE